MTQLTATSTARRNTARVLWFVLMLAAIAVLLAATACGDSGDEQGTAVTSPSGVATAPSEFPTVSPATPTPGAQEPVASDIEIIARLLLADLEAVEPDAFTLISSESVQWSDASLGCPQEGFAYAQVITPGHKLVFMLGDTSYAVHTNADGSNLVPCNDGQ